MKARICVTLCTRQRPKMLARCLQAVLPQLEASVHETSVIVVENDVHESCEDIVRPIRETFASVPIEYLLEDKLGIPYARNRAVQAALRRDADWIVFIDDDEIPCTDWFQNLTAAMEEWEADVFSGPVDLIYPPDHPEWMRMKQFDGRVKGAILGAAATNNTMARARLFSADGLGLRFDARLRFTGGSDVDLFRRAAAAGAVIRWVDDARVEEPVTADRLSARWLLERSRREAANNATFLKSEIGVGPALFVLASRAFRLLGESLFYGMTAAASLLKNGRARKPIFKSRQKLAKLSGSFMPFIGRMPEPYRRIEGE